MIVFLAIVGGISLYFLAGLIVYLIICWWDNDDEVDDWGFIAFLFLMWPVILIFIPFGIIVEIRDNRRRLNKLEKNRRRKRSK